VMYVLAITFWGVAESEDWMQILFAVFGVIVKSAYTTVTTMLAAKFRSWNKGNACPGDVW